jgi:hypothetical protein
VGDQSDISPAIHSKALERSLFEKVQMNLALVLQGRPEATDVATQHSDAGRAVAPPIHKSAMLT